MVVRRNEYKSFPIKTVNAYEGTLTRTTGSFSPTGGTNEGVAVYSAPLAKGDLVVLYQHTTNGDIQVQKAAAGVDVVHGIVVADPFGIDNTTASSGTPTHAYQRKVDIAFFGLGIIELVVSSTGAVEPGDIVGLDADEVTQVETQIAHDGSITVATNGGFVALSYGTDGQTIPIMVGSSLFIGN
jgi:hypothetical protein